MNRSVHCQKLREGCHDQSYTCGWIPLLEAIYSMLFRSLNARKKAVLAGWRLQYHGRAKA